MPPRNQEHTVSESESPVLFETLPAGNGKQLGAAELDGLTPLEGVTFKVERLTQYDLTTNAGWTALQGLSLQDAIDTATKTLAGSVVTGPDGEAAFGNLPLGAYLVTETAAPTGVIASKPFVITVPLTDPDNLNARFRQPRRTLAGMQASFEANLAPVIEANPRVRFSFVYAPYTILVWHDFEQRGQLQVTLAFREWLVERTARYPNVETFDFHADPGIVFDLDRFTDIYHHGPEVSRAVIRAMHQGSHKLTRDTVRAKSRYGLPSGK